jgi:hypothetical protein
MIFFTAERCEASSVYQFFSLSAERAERKNGTPHSAMIAAASRSHSLSGPVGAACSRDKNEVLDEKKYIKI